MTKMKKLVARILSEPADFSWQELVKLLSGLGYRESQVGKTSGSRVRFLHDEFEPIMLHKPHPSPVLKRYQLRQLIVALKARRQL